MGAPDPAIERALDHAKHHWKSPQVLIGYFATLLGIVGAILYWTTKGSSWVSGTYFILVPLIPTLAALFGVHILHLWAMFLIWTFAGLEGSVYLLFKANTEITMAIGIQLAIIAGAFTVAIIHQIWSGAPKVVDQIKSPFGILAAVAWLVVVIGSIVLQTQGGANLTVTVPAVWLATMFLIGQLIPVAGLNAALSVAIPYAYNIFITATCGSTNVSQAGAAVVAAGLTIIILLLVITDYLRHHKPEDLAPEIRAKIASITTSVPLASALLWFVVAIAGYIMFIVGSTGKISCSSNYANFTVILVCLFNFLGNLLDVWRFHYIAFGWFLPIFPALCSTLHVTSTTTSVYAAYILLAIAVLASMLSFNFIDTFKQVPKEVKNVSPPQFVQLAAALLYLIGSVLIFFVKNMILSVTVFPLGLSGLYLMIFAIVIVFFDTSNLGFLTMAMVGLTSYSALAIADVSSDDLLTAGAVFIYIGAVVQAVALALQPPAAGKGKDATAGEASSLL